MSQLIKEQSAFSVNIEVFNNKLLYYTYFRSMFWEVVGKTIEDPQGKPTQLLHLTSMEVKWLNQ